MRYDGFDFKFIGKCAVGILTLGLEDFGSGACSDLKVPIGFLSMTIQLFPHDL